MFVTLFSSRCWTDWLNQQSFRSKLMRNILTPTWRVTTSDWSWRTRWKPAIRFLLVSTSLHFHLLWNPLHFDRFSSAFQIVQELEKQRIETLSNTLDKYSLFMTVYAQTVIHVSNWTHQTLKITVTDSPVLGKILIFRCSLWILKCEFEFKWPQMN